MNRMDTNDQRGAKACFFTHQMKAELLATLLPFVTFV